MQQLKGWKLDEIEDKSSSIEKPISYPKYNGKTKASFWQGTKIGERP